MQQQQLFEYAVIRIVPRVEREEFLNAGVILYCSKLNFLQTLYKTDRERLAAFCGEKDIPAVEENLQAMERICLGGSNAGPIGKLDAASRFRWLTATRSTVVQSSKVHPGFCTDPASTLLRLFTQLVL
ncbi:MAG: DUF3037 domain-containing protein [Aquabacterium sp.]|nr:DUF3037 domain-containing protein [Ferruginibacter sp.]